MVQNETFFGDFLTLFLSSFGSRGRAKSVGPVDSSKCSDEYSCRRCQGRVYEAEKMMAKCGWFHRGCFKCFSCNKIMDASNYQDGLKDGVFCNGCHKMMLEEITTKNSQYAKAVTSTSIIKGTDTSQCCPRCYGVVFDAEKMAMRSGNYHKKCFTCSACKRNLDYLLAVTKKTINWKNKICWSFLTINCEKWQINAQRSDDDFMPDRDRKWICSWRKENVLSRATFSKNVEFWVSFRFRKTPTKQNRK